MTGPMTRLRTRNVRDYMATELMTFSPEMEIADAIDRLVESRFSGAPVVDGDGRLIGMLSEKDCLKVAVLSNMQGVEPGLVGDYMSSLLDSVTPELDLLEVANRFVRAPFKRFPVVEDGKLIGQISRADVLRAIRELKQETP